MDSLDWSKTYDILSISRLFLRDALKFPTQQGNELTDADMQRIADMVAAQYDYLDFCEFVREITSTVLKRYGQQEDSMTDWSKPFCIASINQADLTEFGFTDEQIQTIFTDDVMEEIADKMQADYFLTHPFWEDLQRAVSAFAEIPHDKKD